jgi:tRNA(Arg) A34 adenosine deaminase TadA
MRSRFGFLLATCVLVLSGARLQAAPAEASPDDPACTEQDRTFMKRATDLAAEAVKAGNSPFGAVLVVDGKVVAEFQNEVAVANDPTRHAELGLISTFAPKLDRATLAKSTLYASTEPCAMCCGAITLSGIPKVVYGVAEAKFLVYFNEPPIKNPLTSREIFTRTNPKVEILGPLMEKEGLLLHDAYWPEALKKWSGKEK